jgi:hypothetical protein
MMERESRRFADSRRMKPGDTGTEPHMTPWVIPSNCEDVFPAECRHGFSSPGFGDLDPIVPRSLKMIDYLRSRPRT